MNGLQKFAILVFLLGISAEAHALDLVEMPKPQSGEYVLSSSVGNPGKGRHWGQPAMVRHLILVAKEWKRRHPELPRLRIGDIAKFGGGPFPPHKTHQDGLSVDIFTAGTNICHINYKNQAHTKELADIFIHFGAKQILYNHKFVIDALPKIVRKWPKHDNHFHVVVDPKKVPKDGVPVIVADQGSTAGSWIGKHRLNKDGQNFDLRWRALGGKFKFKSARVRFDDMDSENGVLHDSGPVAARGYYRVPMKPKDRGQYRWSVELVYDDDLVYKIDWTPIQFDLEKPFVLQLGPGDAEEVANPVTFLWQIEDHTKASRYRIEISKSKKGHGKQIAGEGAGLTRHVLNKALKPNSTYYWRVVVKDLAGNEGASDWLAIKVIKGSSELAPKPRKKGEKKDPIKKGTVKPSSLNLRSGPGVSNTRLVALPKGTVVKIVGERSGWLEVEAIVAGKLWKGFVSKSYVDIEGS
ncbi:MAG: penicillin-insensitive murein endopeptidase [Planctomycetota bacterium]|nr:penicillin-insensitive murein endopeptidase [Planctomycetota bacterium]